MAENGNHHLQSMLTSNELRLLIENERERADRNFGDFSLLTIDLKGFEKRSNEYRQLIKSINRRKRSLDRLGRLDKNCIGLLLPNTLKAGAQKLAHDLQIGHSNEKLSACISIYEYPQDWLKQTNESLAVMESDFECHIDSCPDEKSIDRLGGQNALGGLLSNLLLPPYSSPLPWWKRSLDILGSTVLLLVSFPLMALIAAYIKLVSPGPVFFKQKRIGYLGRPFVMWKFRTMRINAKVDSHQNHVSQLIHSDAAMTKLDEANDPRIIPLGRWLRSFCVDELPQLVNILRGEMSLIGPRPAMEYEIKEYQQWQKKRIEVVPGLTGLWQVNGKNKTTFKEMIRLDINYAKDFSAWLDMKIILKTLPVVLNQGKEAITKKS